METVAALAMLTYTPIPFYLGLTLAEIGEWADRAAELRHLRE
ncbi:MULTISPECIES: hypothetical protein [Paenibacillus]|nr:MULTISPECIES: hypothetical protein [Paenibacillus]